MGYLLLKRLSLLLISLLIGLSACADGGEIPWPLGTEAPFPWKSINETVWKVDIPDGESRSQILLRLKVIETSELLKQLQIEEIDGKTNRVVATGIGVEEGFLVRAVMVENDGQLYRLVMRYYDGLEGHKGMGVTFLPFINNDCEENCGYHYLLSRVEDKESQSEEEDSSCSWWNWLYHWWS